MAKHKFDPSKDKTNRFCTTSNIPEQMEQLKITCKDFRKWFWIEHEADDEVPKKHIHVMVIASGCFLVKHAARTLGVPDHMVQWCNSPRQYGRYMIHLDNPEKRQYKPEDVHTNWPGIYKSYLCDSVNDDIESLFVNLRKLCEGKICVSEFIELHRIELQSMPLYQKIKIYEYFEKIAVRPT